MLKVVFQIKFFLVKIRGGVEGIGFFFFLSVNVYLYVFYWVVLISFDDDDAYFSWL